MSQAGSISTLRRREQLEALARRTFDLVIVGAGITGAGVARQAAQRGLSVAVLEAQDFASGTSSRSSKLIHGGLRYLALGDVGLVRESALERKEIFRIAPHLAERRWMVLPVKGYAGLLKFRAAITTYEKLGAVEAEDLNRHWGRAELEQHEPALDRRRWKHACAYREYLTDDARLVLAVLRAAVGDGAIALNHVPVRDVIVEDGRAVGVEVCCSQGGERVRVRGRCVVNAAGPWVEAVARMEDPGIPRLLHLSKGVHIVLPAERLPVRNLLVLGTADRRSIFALRRGDVVYLGTTDTTYRPGARVWPDTTRADVEYLFEPVQRYLDVAPLVPEHVVGAWAGLRPLVAQPGKEPTDISRKDEIGLGKASMITIAGGKLTGYRPTARRVLELVEEVLGSPLAPEPEEPPLPGGDFDGELEPLERGLADRHGVSPRSAARLARLYGTEADAVLGLGAEALVPGSAMVCGEVDWAVEHEGAASAEDVVYRRTRAALYEPDARSQCVKPVVERMARLLDWSAQRQTEEVAAVQARFEADLTFPASDDGPPGPGDAADSDDVSDM